MTFSSFAIVAIAFVLLLSAVSLLSSPAQSVTSLEVGLGPKVTAQPLEG